MRSHHSCSGAPVIRRCNHHKRRPRAGGSPSPSRTACASGSSGKSTVSVPLRTPRCRTSRTQTSGETAARRTGQTIERVLGNGSHLLRTILEGAFEERLVELVACRGKERQRRFAVPRVVDRPRRFHQQRVAVERSTDAHREQTSPLLRSRSGPYFVQRRVIDDPIVSRTLVARRFERLGHPCPVVSQRCQPARGRTQRRWRRLAHRRSGGRGRQHIDHEVVGTRAPAAAQPRNQCVSNTSAPSPRPTAPPNTNSSSCRGVRRGSRPRFVRRDHRRNRAGERPRPPSRSTASSAAAASTCSSGAVVPEFVETDPEDRQGLDSSARARPMPRSNEAAATRSHGHQFGRQAQREWTRHRVLEFPEHGDRPTAGASGARHTSTPAARGSDAPDESATQPGSSPFTSRVACRSRRRARRLERDRGPRESHGFAASPSRRVRGRPRCRCPAATWIRWRPHTHLRVAVPERQGALP